MNVTRLSVIAFVLLAVASISVLSTNPCYAVAYYVSPINCIASGLTWQNAKTKVASALALAVSGDEVRVAKGMYSGGFTVKPGVMLYGGYLGDGDSRAPKQYETVIAGPSGSTGVTLSGTGTGMAVVDGFTIRNVDSGISCSLANSRISNNRIANSSYGIKCQSATLLVNNVIVSNAIGVWLSGSSPQIISNLIIANSQQGVQVNLGSPMIENNTIVDCGDAAISCGGSVSTAAIRNNLIAFNKTGISRTNSATAVTLDHNCVYGSKVADYSGIQIGSTDIHADPKLADIDYGNAHIQAGSPCIDAGASPSVSPGGSDIDGQHRVQGSAVDIGADESGGTTWTPGPYVIVRVSQDGDDSRDGSSWSAAVKTLQKAADIASATGGEVWVESGLYKQNLAVTSYCHVYGGFAGNETRRDDRDWQTYRTRIDGYAGTLPAVVQVLSGNRQSVVVDGFIISGANNGGDLTGVFVRGQAVIRHNTIQGNGSRAVDVGGDCLVTGNKIIGNGGGIYVGNTPAVVVNNTIVGNAQGIAFDARSPATLANNIVAFNRGGIAKSGTEASTLRLVKNCVYGNGADYSGITAGSTDIGQDPMLANLDYCNVHIQPGSPCRDAGAPDFVLGEDKDIDGQARVLGDNVDIGADESDGSIWSSEHATIRVSPDGNDVNDGFSWAKAKKTLQGAVTAGWLDGCEIWVKAGVYNETVVVPCGVDLYGGFSGHETGRSQRDWKSYASIIDGTGLTTNADAVIMLATNRVFDGFTIRGVHGNTYFFAAGVNCKRMQPTVTNCTISGDFGVACYSSSPVISGNTVKGTLTGVYCKGGSIPTISGNVIFGGGNAVNCYETSNAIISDNVMENNTSFAINCDSSSPRICNNIIRRNGAGVNCYQSSPLIANNTLYANSWSGYGVVNSDGSSPIIANNTFAGNNCPSGAITCVNGGVPTIANNIIAFNTSGISVSGTGATAVMRANCVYNPGGFNYSGIAAGAGDIQADPKFTSLQYCKLHIQPGSPCIDAGDDSVVGTGWLDIDAQPRIQGSHVDIGSDESDGTEWTFCPATIRVSPSGSDSNDGSSWALAKKTVQAGIDAVAGDGGEVWVAAGTYSESISLVAGVYLYGGFAGGEISRERRNWTTNPCILDGSGKVVVVKCNLSGHLLSAIDGFTIRNGRSSSSSSAGGIACGSALIITNNYITGCYGGGILTSGSANISHNVVTTNTGEGIICESGTPSISDNTVTDNSSSGIRCWSGLISGNTISRNRYRGIDCQGGDPTISNNTISTNGESGVYFSSRKGLIRNNLIRDNNGQYAGGIYCNGTICDTSYTPTIIGNSIINNSGSTAGGIYCTNSYCTIVNNLVAFNSSGIYCVSNSAYYPKTYSTLRNNCVYNPDGFNYSGDVTPGTGDISVDPLLASPDYGDTHIQPGSPCIDAGDDSVVGQGWIDIDEQQRILGQHVDIGTDESDGTAYTFNPIIVRVSSTGNDSNDGSSWSLAKRTIQTGINAASTSGGEVWVAGGTYKERVTLKSMAYLYGGFAGSETARSDRDWRRNVTVIDGGAAGSVVTADHSGNYCGVDGFTIQNGIGANSYGGGIYCLSASPRISNNIITRNTCSYGYGGGIYCTVASPRIFNSVFLDNSSAYGGAVCAGNSSVAIFNSVFRGNTADYGGAVYVSTGTTLMMTNNTITENWSKKSQGAINAYDSPLRIFNNIIAFNSSGIQTSSTNVQLHNNCVYNPDGPNYSGLSAGTGDISADPRMVLGPFGAVHVQPVSPCIDAGDDSMVGAGWLDIDRQPRVQGAHVDIGADESDGTQWDTTPIIVRVSVSGNDSNDGSSWTLAKKSIQSAIDAVALQGGEVWVAAGRYKQKVTLKARVAVYGGFDGTEESSAGRDWSNHRTILDGGGTGSVVTARGFGSIYSALDGFSIQGGAGTYAGSSYCGGGLFCDFGSPVVANCTITSNAVSGDGAGVYCAGSSPKIINSIISANFAVGKGGGVYCTSGSPSIMNSTITANTAASGGAIYSLSASPKIYNDIVAFNSSGILSSGTGAGVTLGNNCVYNPDGANYTGVSAGVGDISVDPYLVSLQYGRLHIQPGSPCIDAGGDSAVGTGWQDMDGQARIQGAHVDIGADESDGTQWSTEPVIVKVSPSGDDSNDGSNWALAKKTVQSAVDAASLQGGEVWVAAGTYGQGATVAGPVSLYGGFDGTENRRDERLPGAGGSVLSGPTGLAYRSVPACFGCKIDRFTVSGSPSGITCYFAAVEISNNCLVATGGNGINCSYSHATIANNTIAANTGSGIIGTSSILNIRNNIVAFNSSGIVSSGTGASVTLGNNCVYNPDGANYTGVSAGTGDISVDPKLVLVQYGRVHVQPGSPCFDAGNDSVVAGDWQDMDGQARIQGAHVDIGADESDGTQWSAEPRIVRVSPSGDDSNDGFTWAMAKNTVKAAADAVSTYGGEVWVAEGIYAGLSLPRFVHLFGGFAGSEQAKSERDWGLHPTVLTAGDKSLVVSVVYGRGVHTIDGFTLRDVKGPSGVAGISCTLACPLIANNTVTQNNGIGIYCMSSAAVIRNNIITRNKGAISSDSAAIVVVNNLIAENTATSGNGAGGIYLGSWLTGPAQSSALPVIRNNTIVANSGLAAGAIHCYYSPCSISNNIIALNSSGIKKTGGSTYNVTLSNNDVYNPGGDNYFGLTAGTGDVSLDPLFVQGSGKNYRLLPASPCIDAGSSNGAPADDLDGNLRPRDGNGDGVAQADIGCYECPAYYTTLSAAKALYDGAPTGLYGIVTASLPGRSYVESPDRLSGICILGSNLPVSKWVTVEGILTMESGERALINPSVSVGQTCPMLAPWYVNANALGGGPWGLQPGVSDWRLVKDDRTGTYVRRLYCYGGANNIGLLVKLTGKVTNRGRGYFYLDGDCLFDDGIESVKGIRVDWPFSEDAPEDRAFVEITGISSCTVVQAPEGGEVVVRMARPVAAGAVRVLQQP